MAASKKKVTVLKPHLILAPPIVVGGSPVVAAARFKSSNGKTTYETILRANGAVSCDCPGWTRRVDSHGGRTCKHTRTLETHSEEQLKHAPGFVSFNWLTGKSQIANNNQPELSSKSVASLILTPSFEREFS